MQREQLSSGVYSFDFAFFKNLATYIQLFDKGCQKKKSIKAYATMPKGSLGNTQVCVLT